MTETFSRPDGTLNHRFVPRDGASWCDYHLRIGETCGFALEQHQLGSIETGIGYATLNPTPRTETFTVRLPSPFHPLEASGVPPQPARVKVKPLGPSRYEQGNHLYLTSRSGFRAVCTKCGDVETYGMHFADLVADLGRRHLKREHAA